MLVNFISSLTFIKFYIKLINYVNKNKNHTLYNNSRPILDKFKNYGTEVEIDKKFNP